MHLNNEFSNGELKNRVTPSKYNFNQKNEPTQKLHVFPVNDLPIFPKPEIKVELNSIMQKDFASSSNAIKIHEDHIRAENSKGLLVNNVLLSSQIKILTEENNELKWRIRNLERILAQGEPCGPPLVQRPPLVFRSEKKQRKKKDQINRIHKCPHEDCQKAYG